MRKIRNTIIVLLLILGISWFAVSPASQISSSHQLSHVEAQSLPQVLGTLTSQVQLSDQTVTSKVELQQETFNALLKSFMSHQTNKELLEGSYELHDGVLQAKIPYSLFGLVQSQLEMDLRLSLQEEKLLVTVSSAKLGHIPLPNALVEYVLKEQGAKNSSLHISGRTMEISLPQELANLNQISVEEGKMVLDFQLDQNDLLNLGLAALTNQEN